MSKSAYLIAALLVLPAPGFAEVSVQNAAAVPPNSTAQSKKSDLNDLECRSVDEIGSRLERRRVCKTKQQWYSYEQEAKLKMHDLQVLGLSSH